MSYFEKNFRNILMQREEAIIRVIIEEKKVKGPQELDQDIDYVRFKDINKKYFNNYLEKKLNKKIDCIKIEFKELSNYILVHYDLYY